MTARGVAVVDASYMIDVLLGGGELPDAMLLAPAHFDAEVVSAVMRLHRQGSVQLDDTIELLQLLAVVEVQRVGAPPLIDRVVELRDAVAIPDAWYVALAEAMNATLFTADLRLAAACRQQGWCEVVTPVPK